MQRRQSPSHTAQYVAVTRAALHDRGLLDDPHAGPMLTRPMRRVRAVCRRLPVRRSAFLASLAARIALFDREVVAALDDGVDQVVIVGAGYDSRAWRLGGGRAACFEVDHPATQADKVRRAPAGGPAFVPADVSRTSPIDGLAAAGLDLDRPVLYVIEGVTMYLTREAVERLLGELVASAAAGSRLAVNFALPLAGGTIVGRIRQRVLQVLGAAGGERHRFALEPAEVDAFVAATGWAEVRLHSLATFAAGRWPTGALRVDRVDRRAVVATAVAPASAS